MKFLKPEDIDKAFANTAVCKSAQKRIAVQLETAVLNRAAEPTSCYSCDEHGDYDSFALCKSCKEEEKSLRNRIAAAQLLAFARYLVAQHLILASDVASDRAVEDSYLKIGNLQVRADAGRFVLSSHYLPHLYSEDTLQDIFDIPELRDYPGMQLAKEQYKNYKQHLKEIAAEHLEEEK